MEGLFSLFDGHEQVVFGNDPDSGLRCIIAIHSTALGPGLGGTRFYPYTTEEEALVDVLRLSRGMTYKSAAAGLDLGGGKAVIIGDPGTDKSEGLLRAFGRMVESLGGRFITACDVGTVAADMGVIGRDTEWVTGADVVDGGSGDPSTMTAYGVYMGMKAAAARVWGTDDLSGRHVAVQGIGKVGRMVAEHLHAEGAHLTVADVNEESLDWAAHNLGAEIVPTDDIHAVEADIYSPNALGGVISDDSVPKIAAKVIAGSANNQLLEPEHGAALADAGILYCPDYVLNSGGVIQVSGELHTDGYNPERTKARVSEIGDRLQAIFALAESEGIPSSVAADRYAERRIRQIGRLRGLYLP